MNIAKRGPTPKPISDNPKSNTTQPTVEAQNQREQGNYLRLARELNEAVTNVKELYRQFDDLLKEQANLTQKRADLHNQINSVDDPSILRDDLKELNLDLDWQHDKIEAKQSKINRAESELHDLLPRARETAQRLYLAVANHVVEQDYLKLYNLIHARCREEVQLSLTELAVKCQASVDIRDLQPPQIPFLALQSLNGQTLFQSFPTERKDRMAMVTTLAEDLADKLIQMLDKIDGSPLTSFKVPPFLLGPDPIQTDEPLGWQTPPVRYSTEVESVDQEFQWQGKEQSLLSPCMEQTLAQAGKTRQDLTEHLYTTLKHSEKLQRQSARQGGIYIPPHVGY
jgi:hypothetical protein